MRRQVRIHAAHGTVGNLLDVPQRTRNAQVRGSIPLTGSAKSQLRDLGGTIGARVETAERDGDARGPLAEVRVVATDTKARGKPIWRAQVTPTIGDVRLADLRRSAIAARVAELPGELAPAPVVRSIAVPRKMLDDAVLEGPIAARVVVAPVHDEHGMAGPDTRTARPRPRSRHARWAGHRPWPLDPAGQRAHEQCRAGVLVRRSPIEQQKEGAERRRRARRRVARAGRSATPPGCQLGTWTQRLPTSWTALAAYPRWAGGTGIDTAFPTAVRPAVVCVLAAGCRTRRNRA